MGDIEDGTRPKGLFKRETKGQSILPVTVSIERDRIRFFAQVLEYSDPIHSDLDRAREAGHPDLVAPPSFFMVLEAQANEERRRLGEPSIVDLIGCDFRYLLHGDEQYRYGGLLHARDDVTVSSQVVDFYEKKGGAMEFAVIESLVTHSERGVLVRATRTLLHRLG